LSPYLKEYESEETPRFSNPSRSISHEKFSRVGLQELFPVLSLNKELYLPSNSEHTENSMATVFTKSFETKSLDEDEDKELTILRRTKSATRSSIIRSVSTSDELNYFSIDCSSIRIEAPGYLEKRSNIKLNSREVSDFCESNKGVPTVIKMTLEDFASRLKHEKVRN